MQVDFFILFAFYLKQSFEYWVLILARLMVGVVRTVDVLSDCEVHGNKWTIR